MKTISVSVSESDYEAFRRAAKQQARPIAQLLREAMAAYRKQLEQRTPLEHVALLPGHRPAASMPTRDALYDDMFARDERETSS